MGPVEKCLRDSGIDKRNVHEVVSVGGSTCIFKVQQSIQEFFNPRNLADPSTLTRLLLTMLLFRLPLWLARDHHKSRTCSLDVTPLSMGLEIVGGVMTKPTERAPPFLSKKLRPSPPTPTIAGVLSLVFWCWMVFILGGHFDLTRRPVDLVCWYGMGNGYAFLLLWLNGHGDAIHHPCCHGWRSRNLRPQYLRDHQWQD